MDFLKLNLYIYISILELAQTKNNKFFKTFFQNLFLKNAHQDNLIYGGFDERKRKNERGKDFFKAIANSPAESQNGCKLQGNFYPGNRRI